MCYTSPNLKAGVTHKNLLDYATEVISERLLLSACFSSSRLLMAENPLELGFRTYDDRSVPRPKKQGQSTQLPIPANLLLLASIMGDETFITQFSLKRPYLPIFNENGQSLKNIRSRMPIERLSKDPLW